MPEMPFFCYGVIFVHMKLPFCCFSLTSKKKGIPDHVILTTGLHNRYWILDVQEIHGARGSVEKHLSITASKTSHPTEICILKDGW
jgi:hypothetical protein